MIARITGYGLHNMNLIWICVWWCIYQEKELSWYVINSSENYERDLAEKAYSQMVLDGIRMLVNGWDWNIKFTVLNSRMLWQDSFIQKIKDRTECVIDDHFPCRSESCNRQHVTNSIKIFILYLHMKTDRIKLMKFLTGNS